MASAAFTIDSTAVPQSSGEAVATSYGATVSLALSSVVGANSIRWTIVGTSAPDVVTPTITPAGVPLGATATFTVGADAGYGDGVAYAVRCQVRDGGGGMVESFGIVGVRNSAGVVPAVAGEEGSWRHETHGWTDLLNQALKGSGGGGISVLAYGADPTGVADSTPAFQAAIDAAHAAGGGVVHTPAGTYLLGVSALTDAYWVGSAYRAPCNDATDGCCIVMRDGVRLVGAGSGVTILRPVDRFPTVIYLVNGQDQSVEALQIHGKSTLGTTGAAHGIFQVSATDPPPPITSNLVLRDLYIHDVGSYAIGLQSGDYRDTLIENVRVYMTGADGIDIKNRGTDLDNRGLRISNVTIDTFGRRLDGQAGLDMRGSLSVNGLHVFNVGRAGAAQVGIRLRPAGVAEPGCVDTAVVGFVVRAASAALADTFGVQVLGSNNSLLGGSITDCATGLRVEGTAGFPAENNSVANVSVVNASGTGIYVRGTDADYTSLSGCVAVGCGLGFRNEGNYTVFDGCQANACTVRKTASAAAGLTERGAANILTADGLDLSSAATGRGTVRAAGNSDNIDVEFAPKGTGLVRFGVAESAADGSGESQVLAIKDSAGATRRLAVSDTRAGVYNVLAYGADPTGVADSTAAIQAAVQAGAGSEIVFPPGTYTISAAIQVPSDTTLRSTGHATLRLAAGSNSHVIRIADNATNVTIRGLEIDGNKAENAGGHGITSGGASSNLAAIDCDIHDCYNDGIRWAGVAAVTGVLCRGIRAHDNGAAGISGDNLDQFSFLGCHAWDNATHGIGWSGIGTNGSVTGCTSHNNGHGVNAADNYTGYATGNSHLTITGNVSSGGGNNGIHVSGDHVTITGNTVTGATTHGIQMNADGETVCVGSTVSGNTVELCGLSGIWLSDCKYYAVSGNTVSECASHGVWLTNSVGGTVGSNTVTANGTDGIRLDTCDDVAITGNTSRGNTGDGIQINVATYCTVTGNRCQGNATPFVESGASDYNMIAANNLLGNMSNACAVVGAHTQWSTGINGGTPNVASAATITLPKYTNYIVVTGVTNITSITAEPRDRMVTLRFSDILTVTDGGNLRLNGDLVTSASTTLTLQSSGANWWEIARCAT